MAIVKKLQKFGRLPTSLIVNGADFLGVSLAESLLEQSSKVIIVDNFTKENKDRVGHLMESELFTFADFTILDNLNDSMTRIDYIFFLNYSLAYHEEKIDTQFFMRETKHLDTALKLGVKKKSKFLYASSMEVDRYLASLVQHGEITFNRTQEDITYTTVELQRYSENLITEYHKKSSLNTRIIRLGEVYGEGMEVERQSELTRLLRSAVNEEKLVIYGEGLQTRYYLHVLDATYGLIKAQFGHDTNGEIFSLANTEEVSELSLAYKILEFNPNAQDLDFEEVDRRIYPSRVSVPAESLSVIGWSPHIDFEKGLYKTLSYFFAKYKKPWKNKPMGDVYPEDDPYVLEEENSKKEEAKTEVGQEESEKKEPKQVDETKVEEEAELDERTEEEKTKEKMLLDKTKRVVEVKKQDGEDADIVRVLPLGEDRTVRSEAYTSNKIPKTVQDPKILKWLLNLAIWIPLFLFVIFPVLRVVTFTGIGLASSAIGVYQIRNYEVESAAQTFSFAESMIGKGSGALSYFEKPLSFVGLRWPYDQMTYLFSGMEHTIAAAERGSNGMIPWIEYLEEFEPLVDPNDVNLTASADNISYKGLVEEMAASSEDLEDASKEFSEAEAAFKRIDRKYLPSFANEYIDGKFTELHELVISAEKAANMSTYVPELLGVDGRKTYLVLMQNPMEIRSTGGWIGGYAVVSVEYGQIRRLDVDDIYNADGRLQVENRLIPPPTDMKEALGVRQWTLSLSNWQADYQFAARDSEYVAQDILDIADIDGVIAVDTYVMRDLLEIIGEVDTGGSEGIVTSENLFDKILTLREGFQPTSQRKSTFIGRLSDELLGSMLKLSKDRWPEVGDTVVENLDEKHILLSFDDPNASRTVSENGWGGSVLPNNQCNFYLYPVDYNWSGNKVNAYISRDTSTKATAGDFSENVLYFEAETVINYKNSSQPNSYEGGDYENYLRVYLPENSQIISYKGFRADQVKIYSEYGKTVIAGWVDVSAGSSETVTISYDFSTALLLNESDNSEYSSFVSCLQKQPGIDTESVFVELNFPEGVKLRQEGEGADNIFIIDSESQKDEKQEVLVATE